MKVSRGDVEQERAEMGVAVAGRLWGRKNTVEDLGLKIRDLFKW